MNTFTFSRRHPSLFLTMSVAKAYVVSIYNWFDCHATDLVESATPPPLLREGLKYHLRFILDFLCKIAPEVMWREHVAALLCKVSKLCAS